MSEKSQAPDIIAQLDQIETTLENLGKTLGTYYRNLVVSGVPESLSERLVIDYHYLLWSSIFIRHQNPPNAE